jgi:hypothetical protein
MPDSVPAEIAVPITAYDVRMTTRPSYMPSRWMMGRLGRRWVGEDPKRVIAWLVGNLIASIGLIALCAVIGRLEILIVVAAASTIVLREVVVYAPRAYRASESHAKRQTDR